MNLRYLLSTFLLASALAVLGCQRPDSTANGQAAGPSSLQEKTVGTILLQPQTLLNGQLQVLLPAEFAVMDEVTLRTKYPNDNRPTLVYTNEPGSINVAFHHTENAMQLDQLDALQQQLDASIRQSIPDANWMFSGFQFYQGQKWVQLEFVSPAIDTNIHNLMVATSLDNRMLVVSFNVTEPLADEWLPAGRAIIQSLSLAK